MNDLLLFSFLTRKSRNSPLSGEGALQQSAQYLLCTVPSRNISASLERALEVFAKITAPLTGRSRRWGTPRKTCPGFPSRTAI